MNETLSKISLYHGLFLICLAGALVLLAASLILFFRQDIWSAAAFLTGRRARREIRRLEAENSSQELGKEMRHVQIKSREEEEATEVLTEKELRKIWDSSASGKSRAGQDRALQKKRMKKKLLLFFLLLGAIQNGAGLEGLAQPVDTQEMAASSGTEVPAGAEEDEEMEEPEGFPPFSEGDIVLSEKADENGWVKRDTTFTIVIPEEWDMAECPLLVEYRKQEDAEWNAMAPEPGQPSRFAFTETDPFYDGAYQFRLSDDSGRSQPEEGWVTLAFRKDGTAPLVWTECAAADAEGAGKRYYGGTGRESIQLTLIFEETGFASQKDENGEMLRPQLTVLKDGSRLGKEETAGWIEWSAFEDGRLSAQILFPWEDGEEACYQVEAEYQDAAGNPLTGAKGGFGQMADAERGIFVTGSLVLDGCQPKLLSLEAQGNYARSVLWEGSRIPLYRNVDGADITFALVIDDGEKEWQEQAFRLQVLDVEEGRIVAELTGDDSTFVWKHEGRAHQAVFAFDGEEGKESAYQLRFTYKDRAGNLLGDGRQETGEAEEAEAAFPAELQPEGVFASGVFFLDHAAPLLCVTYTESARLVKDGKDYTASRTPVTGCTSYYSTDIIAEIVIQDAGLEPADSEGGKGGGPEGFRLEIAREADGTAEEEKAGGAAAEGETDGAAFEGQGTDGNTAAVQWSVQEGGIRRGKLQISEEGDYRIRIFYADAAGNPARADEPEKNLVQGTLENGQYESPLLVLDKTAPVLSLCYTEAPAAEYRGRIYFNTASVLQLTVEDRNFRVQELLEVLLGFTAEDSGGRSLKEDTELMAFLEGLDGAWISRTVWNTALPLGTDANYRIPIALTDLAGNQAAWKGEASPGGSEQEPAEEGGAVKSGAQAAKGGVQAAVHMEYPTVDTGAPSQVEFSCSKGRIVNYLPSGWLFSGEASDIEAAAGDTISGIREIRFEFTDLEGKESVQAKKFEPSAAGTFRITLPPEGEEDFKGTAVAKIYDWAGNCLVKSGSCAVEGAGRHEASGYARIDTLTEPSRVVEGTAYYNTDVVFRLTVGDTFSGLRSFRYSGGSTLEGGRDYAAEAGERPGAAAGQEITYEFSQELTLKASANNENHVPVEASYIDNAGHTGAAEQRFHIDVTAPEVSVVYDLNEPSEGRYYSQPRTATVTIRERNFDERDVDFQITGTEGSMPEISGWTSYGSGDDTVHVCRLIFSEDGDYTFTLAFQDLAGNRAAYGRTDEFTIDRTAPELAVDWDNMDSRNGIYFAGSRTAVITVQEHNFDESRINIAVTAELDMAAKAEGEKAGTGPPSVSAWKKDGDRHTARVVFAQDGRYTLSIGGEDLAGNRMEEYTAEAFVIDCTPPRAVISAPADRSANKAEVRPEIRYWDANLDPEGTEIFLAGGRKGEFAWEGIYTAIRDGMEVKLDDFACIPEMDDMYTLRVSVLDLAGNRSEKQISFSVNRFGSVYSFDAETEALAGENGSYYTNREQDIVVTETNVDTLEFREITCSQDGKLRTLEEGRDYTVKENGDSSGWKQYTYTIGRENFKEEGNYLLVIYSEDRAENASDTGSKGKRIEFAVDRTRPDILVSGAENGGRYREGEREVTLDIQDNLRLQEVEVSLNGEKKVYSASELDGNGGRIVLRIGAQSYWQELEVRARDAAGNPAQTEKLRLLVTPDLLVQFLMNKTACRIAAAVILLLAAGAGCLLRVWTCREKKAGSSGERRQRK